VKNDALTRLAREAGLSVNWADASGERRTVSTASVRAALEALGLASNTPSAIAESRRRLAEERTRVPPMVVTTVGERIEIPTKARGGKLIREDGAAYDVRFAQSSDRSLMRAPNEAGYHALEFGNQRLSLATAPRSAFRIPRPQDGGRLWGTTVQVYSLQKGSTSEFGDFSALAAFCERIAAVGGDAVGLSPLHALLPSALSSYSPYSPSSRLFLNPIFVPTGINFAAAQRHDLIDWHSAYPRKLRALQQEFAKFKASSGPHEQFSRFVAEGGERLLGFARFEALHKSFLKSGCTRWRDWPLPYRNATSAAVRKLGRSDPEIEFQLFLQWRADTCLGEIQTRARTAGMAIGLIADLAVGIDTDGSDAWSTPDEVLSGLSIGAPADRLGPDGQNWGLTAYSPLTLREKAYAPFIAILRAAMRNAGGIRIDHAMGMERLWVIPSGAPSSEGVYLSFPIDDLLRIAALESRRHRAIVIAEDLGTVPASFRAPLARAQISGMRVLWFERDRYGDFAPPERWTGRACALTSTHDLPTFAGWWSGRDIDWRARVSRGVFDKKAALSERSGDRRRLWDALKKAKCVRGRPPPPGRPLTALDGVLRFVAKTGCVLSLFPLEDIAGALEQPNLPGTTDEHPNWRRRLPFNVLENPTARRRLQAISRERTAR
jgi:4-alpha-glucanotransferase